MDTSQKRTYTPPTKATTSVNLADLRELLEKAAQQPRPIDSAQRPA